MNQVNLVVVLILVLLKLFITEHSDFKNIYGRFLKIAFEDYETRHVPPLRMATVVKSPLDLLKKTLTPLNVIKIWLTLLKNECFCPILDHFWFLTMKILEFVFNPKNTENSPIPLKL